MARKVRTVTLGAALILAASTAAAAARLPDLGTRLELAQSGISDSRVVNVTVTVTNRTGETQSFLRRGTPFADLFDAPMFAVERDGQPLTYLGRVVKYMPPRAEDFIELAPGESRSITVNLGDVFDLAAAGRYRVQLRAPARGAAGAASSGALEGNRSWAGRFGSNIVEFDIAPNAVRLFTPPARREGMVRPRATPNSAGDTFTGCSAEEQAAVEDAIDKGCEEAAAAAAAAAAAVTNGAGDENYAEWWGAFNAGRAATVSANWDAIRDALCPSGSTKKMEYVCHGPDCTPGVYAYVFPGTEPNTIYLCDGFWGAVTVGFDSRPGVLIHEMSHLKAGTDDHAYGTTACRDLASTDPATAIDNADNYEYYAEDLNWKAKAPGLTPVGATAAFAFLAAAGVAVLSRRRRSLAA